MNWNAVMHIAGWVCLLSAFAIAVWSMYEVVRPQWRRILSLAAGNIEPAFEPLPVILPPAQERAA